MTNSLSLQIAAQGAALREDTTEVIEEPVESPQTVTEVSPEESKVGTNSVRRFLDFHSVGHEPADIQVILFPYKCNCWNIWLFLR